MSRNTAAPPFLCWKKTAKAPCWPNCSGAQSREFATESTVKGLATAITYAKNQMLADGELDQLEVEGCDFPALYRTYCQTMREHQWMDYDDQMVYALRILRRCPDLLARLRARWQYLCVDEAQDTSKIQHVILRLLAGGKRQPVPGGGRGSEYLWIPGGLPSGAHPF